MRGVGSHGGGETENGEGWGTEGYLSRTTLAGYRVVCLLIFSTTRAGRDGRTFAEIPQTRSSVLFWPRNLIHCAPPPSPLRRPRPRPPESAHLSRRAPILAHIGQSGSASRSLRRVRPASVLSHSPRFGGSHSVLILLPSSTTHTRSPCLPHKPRLKHAPATLADAAQAGVAVGAAARRIMLPAILPPHPSLQTRPPTQTPSSSLHLPRRPDRLQPKLMPLAWTTAPSAGSAPSPSSTGLCRSATIGRATSVPCACARYTRNWNARSARLVPQMACYT